MISQTRIKKHPEHASKFDNYPKPTTVKELQQFLGPMNLKKIDIQLFKYHETFDKIHRPKAEN